MRATETTKSVEPRRTWRSRRICLVSVFFVLSVALISVALVAQDRTKPPQLGPPPQLDLPSIQKRTLSNGLPVWIVETHEVPVVQVNLVVLAGSGDDPAERF